MVPGFYSNHDVEVRTLATLEIPHMRHQNASVKCISDKLRFTNIYWCHIKEKKDIFWEQFNQKLVQFGLSNSFPMSSVILYLMGFGYL